ncbi:endonuclease/exonuclease/phosphatase family protein [Ruegeria sp. 2205SS24-7]|uniref:endonuclease/exonuclease/phosphatase family protein n=1 Tax=Ruegeria discodermiae TaxID=3064389 RepID=UPI002740471D|nr:endonuclease/exonuclease/phosphatase family protein [Ruegeria sp. 2205SS24-7]MDP5219767.1 endonuclease/exonuclease/phosphatase family protein [Ruegeria sp. 2205SS24-7]
MIHLALALLLGLPAMANAQPLRVATYNTELSRDGPGLFLRDIETERDPRIRQVIQNITQVNPDIIVLQSIDWDHEGKALSALTDKLADAGARFDHILHLRPNSGMATDLDLDGDGLTGGPGDAQGYGAFAGQGGIAILSKHPILYEEVRDFSTLLWRDLPWATLPQVNGQPFPSAEAQEVQRLSSTAHWVVPIETPTGRIDLLTFQAGPPVFDGPEDRNGLRNRDEILFWRHFLDGQFGPPPEARLILLGGANLDPHDSDGRGAAIRSLLTHPKLQDTTPQSRGAEQAPDQGHKTPNALDTVDWVGPGRMRVDYILPSRDWQVAGSGVFWPAPGDPMYEHAVKASRHRLVWADLTIN